MKVELLPFSDATVELALIVSTHEAGGLTANEPFAKSRDDVPSTIKTQQKHLSGTRRQLSAEEDIVSYT
jgi:hypothetical protein